MNTFTCLPALILRTPLYSFCDYNPENLKTYLKDPYFILAIYLASPQLYKIVEDANYDVQQLNKSEQLSLLKYINRMHYRPTPFGSFSAFSITRWDKSNPIHLGGLDKLNFHTDWDHEVVLKVLSAHANKNWQEELLHLNHTLYEVKEEYRYVRTHFNFDNRTVNFSLEALNTDPLIKEVLSLITQPKTGRDLLETLCEQLNFKMNEANDYILFLLETQLLLTSSHPNVLGANAIQKSFLKNPFLNFPDLGKAKTAQDNLNKIFEDNSLTPSLHTFYTNTQRPATGGLDPAIQDQLLPVLEILSKMLPLQLPPALKTFIEAFKARYDQEEVSLLKALDPEIGIDYATLTTNSTTNELLDDLDFPAIEQVTNNISWLAIHKLLLRKWNSTEKDIPEIALDCDEPEIVEQNKAGINLPPSVAVIFRVLGDQILLESAGGVTGCSLIGRFANFDLEVKKIADELTITEQATNPNVIFAEIGQLSGMHVDNINKRLHLYKYEIPINKASSLPIENQIHLSDLYLSIKQNRLVIRSKKLDKEIIPRLSSAYNYNHNDMALFRFLCDMQHQDIQSNCNFNIESFFPGLSSYPRVKLGNVIISHAKWYLKEEDIQNMSKSIVCFNKISQQKCWPQYIALTQNDQQLIFNLSNDADINLLQSCIVKQKKILIQEYFLCNKTVTNPEDKPIINQFIAFFTNTKPSYHSTLPPCNKVALSIDRNFSLGSNWIYLKIYCHEHVANNLLGNELLKLLSALEASIINKWFFVRYTDPKPHIRLRILAEKKHLAIIINKLNTCLNESVSCNIIQGYQADVYRREIERYGQHLIEEVENVFYYSSKLVCKYIKQLNTISNTSGHYSLAIISTYQIINLFNEFIGDQISFTNTIAKALYQEFAQDKSLQISLDQKYRIMKPEIEQLLINYKLYKQLKLDKEVTMFLKACDKLKERALNIPSDRKIALVADIIHMHLNRIFFDHQRKQELCIYYMLNKYFITQKAIARNKELSY